MDSLLFCHCYNANHLIFMVGWGPWSLGPQELSLHMFFRNRKEHQNAPSWGSLLFIKIMKAYLLLKTHDYSSSEVSQYKPLALTGTAQTKPKAADHDKEYSLGRRQPPDLYRLSGSSSYLSLEGGKWRRWTRETRHKIWKEHGIWSRRLILLKWLQANNFLPFIFFNSKMEHSGDETEYYIWMCFINAKILYIMTLITIINSDNQLPRSVIPQRWCWQEEL